MISTLAERNRAVLLDSREPVPLPSSCFDGNTDARRHQFLGWRWSCHQSSRDG